MNGSLQRSVSQGHNPQEQARQKLQNYTVEKQLGSGQNTKIMLAVDNKQRRKVALKIIDSRFYSGHHKQKLLREIAYHERIRGCPHIIRIEDHFVVGDLIYIVMEYAPRGDLFNYLKDHFQIMGERQRRKLLFQVCLAVQHMHRLGFMHRDIKPENILLDQNLDAKLCDFGWCCHLDDANSRYDNAGTFEYMSPECLRREYQDKATDIWSLGILSYEIYHGIEPFPGRTAQDVLKAVYESSAVFRDDIPEDAIDFFSQCVRFKPENRIDIEQVVTHRVFDDVRGIQGRGLHLNIRRSNEEDSQHSADLANISNPSNLIYRPSRAQEHEGGYPSVQQPIVITSNASPIHSVQSTRTVGGGYFHFPPPSNFSQINTNQSNGRSPLRYSPLTSPQRSVSPATKQQQFTLEHSQFIIPRPLNGEITKDPVSNSFIRPQVVPSGSSPPQKDSRQIESGQAAGATSHRSVIMFGQQFLSNAGNIHPPTQATPAAAGMTNPLMESMQRKSHQNQQAGSQRLGNAQRSYSHGILHVRPPVQTQVPQPTPPEQVPAPFGALLANKTHFLPNPLISGLQRHIQAPSNRPQEKMVGATGQMTSRISNQIVSGQFSFNRTQPLPQPHEEQKVMFGATRTADISGRQRTSGVAAPESGKYIRQPILAIGGKSFQESMTAAVSSDGFTRMRPEMNSMLLKTQNTRTPTAQEAIGMSGGAKLLEHPAFGSSTASTNGRHDSQPMTVNENHMAIQQLIVGESRDREYSQERQPVTARPMVVSLQNQIYQKQLRPASVTISRDRRTGFEASEIVQQSQNTTFGNVVSGVRVEYQQQSAGGGFSGVRTLGGHIHSSRSQAAFGPPQSSGHTASASLLPERPMLQLNTPKSFERRFF